MIFGLLDSFSSSLVSLLISERNALDIGSFQPVSVAVMLLEGIITL